LAIGLALTVALGTAVAADKQAEKAAKKAEKEAKKAAKKKSEKKPSFEKFLAARSSQLREYKTFGEVERLSSELDLIIPPGALPEKLASSLEYADGPLWNRKNSTLLFSDVPQNRIGEWTEGVGTTFKSPSGYTGTVARGGQYGSSGLAFDLEGRLVICQHGDRRVVRVGDDGNPKVLAEYHMDRRLNGPHDLVFKSNGDFYFTDPSFGLEKGNADPSKEIVFNGVYLVRANGQTELLTSSLGHPDGIALSPDETVLYVSDSDPAKPRILAYPLTKDGLIEKGRVFFDVSSLPKDRKGTVHGIKVDIAGNLFVGGPSGILIISPEGKHLGSVLTGEETSNCAWGGKEGSVLYITSDMYLCRIRTTTRGKVY
jgi:gluconolactonase